MAMTKFIQDIVIQIEIHAGAMVVYDFFKSYTAGQQT